MNKLKFILAATAIMVGATVAAQSVDDLSAKLTKAADAVNAKNYTQAIPLFEEVIAGGADDETAEQLVTQAKQLLPTAIFRMGGSQYMSGNLDEALASFTRAAELAELYGNVSTLNNARKWIGQTVLKQGETAFNSGDFATAAGVFQKGYDANPNDSTLALNLAMSYTRMGDYARGNDIYRALIARQGDNRFAEAAGKAHTAFIEDNLDRASSAAAAKNFAETVAATEDILALDAANATAQMYRINAYNNMKNYDKVIELGDAAAAAQTTDVARSGVDYLVGVAYQNRQNYPRAIEYYKKVTAGNYAASAKTQAAELQKAVK